MRALTSFGTDESVRRAVTAYSRMLLRLAMTRLPSSADAEDVVQEVFLKLLTARPQFRDAEHEKAWLIRATLHRACDMARSAERRNLPLEAAEAVPGGELPEPSPRPFRRAGPAGEIQRCDPPLLL